MATVGERKCKTCGKALTKDEIGATKKLINRGAREFLCVDCLARFYEVAPKEIERKIAQFKEDGCTLFQ